MTTPDSSLLLAEAPAGRHFAQFHRAAPQLDGSVATFLEGGLRRGNSIVVIAAPENSDRFLEGLNERKLHPQALRHSGQLEVIDARELVQQCMLKGAADWARFRGAVTLVLEHSRPYGRGTRVYSELTSLLWRDGNSEAAILLEGYWNDLSRTQAFSVYCGYTFDTQQEESYAGPLEQLGHAHSDILGAVEDEQFGVALDRASKEIFGISLTQMAGMTRQDGARRFPSGQRTMIWVKRNLPMSTAQLVERARRYFQEGSRAS